MLLTLRGTLPFPTLVGNYSKIADHSLPETGIWMAHWHKFNNLHRRKFVNNESVDQFEFVEYIIKRKNETNKREREQKYV